MLLHIDIVNKVATYQKRDGCIVCGNSGYQIGFNFDSEWNNVSDKQAVLIVNGTPVYADIKNDIQKVSFDNVGIIDATGAVVLPSEKYHTDIIAISDLVNGPDGKCVQSFDIYYTEYPKVVFFSGATIDTFISGLTVTEIGNKDALTADEIRSLAASVDGATHVAFNSDIESALEDYVYVTNGIGEVCDVPIIRNADKITVGVYSEAAGMTTTGTEIPCKKSILCT